MASGDSLPSFDTVTLSFHTCVPIPHASRCALTHCAASAFSAFSLYKTLPALTKSLRNVYNAWFRALHLSEFTLQ